MWGLQVALMRQMELSQRQFAEQRRAREKESLQARRKARAGLLPCASPGPQ